MLLTLNSNDPWDATYTNESGLTVYRCTATTAFTLSDRHFTLYKDRGGSGSSLGDMDVVGEVVFNTWISGHSRLTLSRNGVTSEGKVADEMFRKSGSWWGNRHGSPKTFTATDGNDYTWTFGRRSCSLHPASNVIGSESSFPPIIKFKRRSFGIFSAAHPTQVEVASGYERILDIVLLSLIFLEKVKRDKERRRNAAN
ncbi:hypothetical protein BJ165DRAFT_1478583 [Panaeolus papilionaceus]|nr:hypothetical protein BJ165DRAFT_1478583 [Panaeolus papilionaceus]